VHPLYGLSKHVSIQPAIDKHALHSGDYTKAGTWIGQNSLEIKG